MSYEGYSQYLCENGHETVIDAMEECFGEDLKICPRCSKPIVWRNCVDTTNGSWDEKTDERIDGYVELEIKNQIRCDKCNSILGTTYKIPKE